MLWIQNVTPGERPDNEPHDYVVRINREPPLGVFQHVRELGAAECLRAAAVAIDRKPTPPAAVVEAMEQALRFYDKSWNATPNKRYGGLEWKPREALLDDCGNCAKSALADLDKWRAGK